MGKTYKEVSDIIHAGCKVSTMTNEQLNRKKDLSSKLIEGALKIPTLEMEDIGYVEG